MEKKSKLKSVKVGKLRGVAKPKPCPVAECRLLFTMIGSGGDVFGPVRRSPMF